MSKLDELIKELCPNGVEYQTIGNLINNKIIEIISPSIKIKRNDYKEIGDIPIISQEMLYISGYCNITEGILPDDEYVCFGDHSEHIKYIDFSFVQGADGLKIMKLKEKLMAKYFYYAISSAYVKHNNYERHYKYLVDTLIPVPPLEVQREIVRILDSFTLLTAELTAELTARKKQYEYYRDELLKPHKSIPMVTLKEIAGSIYRGTGIKRDQVTEDGVPCVRYGEIYTTYNTWFDECASHTKEEYVSSPKYFEHGDILFAITGESVEDISKSIAYIGHDKCLAGGDIVVMKHNQNPRYLAHVLNTSMAREQKSKGKVKSKVVHSNVSSIEQIRIPLPTLEVQERYADVLDNFEKICNDLNIGLPAEIEARKKQYEYYRDVLLTFAETGSTILTDRQTDRQ